MGWTRFTVGDLITCGKYMGQHRTSVSPNYIKMVCDKTGKYFSMRLAKFFADDMMRIIKNKQSSKKLVIVYPAIKPPSNQLNKCNGRSKKGANIRRSKAFL